MQLAIPKVRPVQDLQSAERLCRRLMDQYGLSQWLLKINKTKGRCGRCVYADMTIEISIYQPEGDPTDTVLHEIAHALTPGDGHGWRWRMKCREIGANPNRCTKADHDQGIGYRYTCAKCNQHLGTTAGKMRTVGKYVTTCCKAAMIMEKN